MPALPRNLADLARTLKYFLGHRPDDLGLVLDAAGFVPVKRLLAALAGEPGLAWVRRRHLEELAVLQQPPGIELAGDRIRSLMPSPPELRRPGEPVPTYLYIAIPPRHHPRVWEEGLRSPAGEELVLARSPEMALKLGKRRAPEPVPVTVQAQAAARQGVTFTAYGEELFLAREIPRSFLELSSPPPVKEAPRPSKPPGPPPVPGELRVDLASLLTEGPRPKARRRDEPAWKTATRKERRRRR
jgi:putative RNA 2'-phosphotransferase